MKKFAKTIRIITLPPITAIILLTILYISSKDIMNNIWSYLIGIFALGIMPFLAYPIQRFFKIFKGDMRKGERTLAIIFSIVGYFIGFILAYVLKAPSLEKALYFTYVISGTSIALFSFFFKINASGHACGVAGPLTAMVYILGWWYAFLLILLVIVFWSSIYLKRHTFFQLILGSAFSILTFLLSVIIYI